MKLDQADVRLIVSNNARSIERLRERLVDQLKHQGNFYLRMAASVEDGNSHREGIVHGRAVSDESIDNLAGRIAELEEQNELWKTMLDHDGT
jgi:hypothetical protein